MIVYITKYALTQGIFEKEAKMCGTDGRMINCDFDTNLGEYYFDEGKDWHRTLEGAIARAEEMRTKKVASLQKSLKKIKALKF